MAFLLADNGFDVWLANTRGTKYSRGHISLSPNDKVSFLSLHMILLPCSPSGYSIFDISLLCFKAYWQWTWDELVAYEFPDTVQYVHDQTGQKLHYVGHSLVNFHTFCNFLLCDLLISSILL